MHGIVDVSMGAIIGAAVVVLRLASGPLWDHFVLFSHSLFVVPTLFAVYYAYIVFHPVPVDDCPCFEDSLSFVGVMLGLDLSHYVVANTPLRNADLNFPVTIGFNYDQLGLACTLLRVVLGVSMVVTWKELSKPFIVRFLPLDTKQPCFALKGRASNDIWVKFFVYSGISLTVVVGTKIVFPLMGIDSPM